MNEVAVSAGAMGVAQRAHELGMAPTYEQCEELSRAALERAEPYLDGVGPDLGWPPLPDPLS